MNRRISLGLLVASYVILVVIVAYGALFIQKEFEDADHDRCDILGVQVRLAYLQIELYSIDTPPVELPPSVQDTVDQLVANIIETCPELGDM
jgi:hypothetical protein